jgi:flagellar hook-associated protein 3 FlgL
MISPLDGSSTAFLNSMEQISRRLDRAQRQLSSGVRVANISDDPDHIATLLQAKGDLESAQQIQANLGRAKTECDTAEQALESAVKLVERARVLGAQGASSTTTTDGRAAAGAEVGAIMEQLVALTRTTVEGRYVFSGDTDQQAPYTIDLTKQPPVSAYAGAAVTREIQHPNGTRFTIARTAQQIFDAPDPTQSVFQSLDSLRTALNADDLNGVNNAVTNVAKALTYLNSQVSAYGAIQNKIAGATDFGNNLQLQLKTHISTLQDADMTEAILELTQATTQQNAALQARAKAPRTTLFDYLG